MQTNKKLATTLQKSSAHTIAYMRSAIEACSLGLRVNQVIQYVGELSSKKRCGDKEHRPRAKLVCVCSRQAHLGNDRIFQLEANFVNTCVFATWFPSNLEFAVIKKAPTMNIDSGVNIYHTRQKKKQQTRQLFGV